MLVAELSFWHSVGVEFFKAFFTAAFVAIGAALVVFEFQSRAQERREATERAREEAARQREREREEATKAREREREEATKARERELQIEQSKRDAKTELITRASNLAGSFYFLTQRFSRQKTEPKTWGQAKGPELDAAYVDWARQSEALEQVLGVRYGWDSEAQVMWHQLRDLLTIRYFHLRGRNSDALRAANALTNENRHSGLSQDALADMDQVIPAIRSAMQAVARRLLGEDIAI